MREIKFRALCVADGEQKMVYFKAEEFDDGVKAWPSPNGIHHIDEYISPLMLYTGLNDKNQTEIYNGDIVKLNGGGEDVIFAVDFEEGCFVARVPWKMENSPELKAYCYFKEEIMTVEVIGNIYEKPELLNTDTEAK